MRLTWVQPEDLLVHALVQARHEGIDVDEVEARWRHADGPLEVPLSGADGAPATPDQRALAGRLLDEIDALRPPAHADLEEIRGRSPKIWTCGRRPDERLLDRVHGGWLGRSAGCLLGKPVEEIPRAGIEEILRSTGRWPLESWFTAQGLDQAVAARWPWNRRSASTSLVENIDGMPEDDDLNFAVLALRMLDVYGCDLTTQDVATTWLENLPAGRVFTAERVAYRNLLDGVEPDRAALVRNPFRHWIGALIRTDVYGWTHPGDLVEASRLAWVDARLSHTAAGVHGAMWAAALAAAAVVNDEVDDVLEAAGSVVPAHSRLAAAVRTGTEVGRSEAPLDQSLDALHAAYGHLHWVHVLNNAATIAFALARGGGDFGASISLAVMAGWDTDSVGATVGGVVGALRGVSGLAEQWTGPIDNRLATSLPGPNVLAIDGLARQTVELAARFA
jgi:ADP-ribosylglycohydrolase